MQAGWRLSLAVRPFGWQVGQRVLDGGYIELKISHALNRTKAWERGRFCGREQQSLLLILQPLHECRQLFAQVGSPEKLGYMSSWRHLSIAVAQPRSAGPSGQTRPLINRPFAWSSSEQLWQPELHLPQRSQCQSAERQPQ